MHSLGILRWLTIPLLLGTALDAEEPFVVRLMASGTPARVDEFAAVYEQELAPLLAKYGLVPAAQQAGPATRGTYCRLFPTESTAAFVKIQTNLQADPAFQRTVERLRRRFADVQTSFSRYAPLPDTGRTVVAGPGRTVKAGAGSRRGPWYVLGVADGLPDPAVLCVFQDRDGILWLGTDGGGVSRYDGEELTTFTTQDGLPSNSVSSIVQDQAGNLWFGTGTWRASSRGNGVCRFDGRTFTVFSLPPEWGYCPVLSLLAARDGQVWASVHSGGVSRFDGRRMEHLDLPDAQCLAQDRQGRIWLGTAGGVQCLDGQNTTVYTTAEGLANSDVFAILPDREGRVWFGTAQGVSRLEGGRFTHLAGVDGLAQDTVTAILQDRRGDLWFGTWRHGASRLDSHGLTSFGPADGLAHWRVLSLAEDRSGDLWFGGGGEDASGNGVTRYVGDEFTTFTTADGLVANEVMCLAEDRLGRLWAGTWAGACWYDGTRFHPLAGLTANVRVIREDRHGNLWFGTREGAYRFDGTRLTHLAMDIGPEYAWVQALAEDAQGTLWFGTPSGIARLDGQRWTVLPVAQGMARFGLRSLCADGQGNLWCGTAGNDFGGGGAVGRFNGKEWAPVLTIADGLANSRVTWITEDRQGNLWFGSEAAGVTRYDGRNLRVFTTADGLGSNKILHVLAARDGRLWLAAYGGGVSRYDGTVFQALLQRDGLAHDATQQVLEDRNGDFWIASEGGLTRYRPRHETVPVRITRVTADRDYGPAAEVSLSSSQGFLAFEFAGRSLRTRPEQMLYLYQLEGQDTSWRQTRERRVTYTDLPVGEYVFRVRAVDRDLSYSEPVSVQVRVRPPWERLAWLTALGLAALGLAWQTGRVIRRDRRLRTSNQALSEANRQVQEATRRKSEFLSRMSHDLRTPMNAIVGYTGILLRKTRGVVDERQYRNLENIQVSANHLLSLINDILDLSRIEAGRIQLRPEAVHLAQLVTECVQSVQSLVKPEVEVRLQVEDATFLTDADRVRRVLMNLLSNAVKFTSQGSITVSLVRAGETIELAVADTGIGIPADQLPLIFEEFRQVEGQGPKPEGSGLGLAIARRSVELLGGTLGVTSEPGQGSCFTVRLPDRSAESAPDPS